MTIPRAVSDLLIFLASSNVWPEAPVLPTCKRVHMFVSLEREIYTFKRVIDFFYLFGTSQINQVQFATLGSTGIHILLSDGDLDDGVTSGAFSVHV